VASFAAIFRAGPGSGIPSPVPTARPRCALEPGISPLEFGRLDQPVAARVLVEILPALIVLKIVGVVPFVPVAGTATELQTSRTGCLSWCP
jgi:hypothetical protein